MELKDLKKLPSVVTKNRFTEKGLVETDSGLLVPAYIANQFGFSWPGREFLKNTFYPELRKAGVLPLCPFEASREYLELPTREFNHTVGIVNYQILMPKSKLMIAILDGGHAADDGVAAEIGHYATRGYGPVIGIRSDIRLAENEESGINIAVRYFMDRGPYGGMFFSGESAYKDALRETKTLADRIRRELGD